MPRALRPSLLSFPLTDFDEQGEFRPDTYAKRLEWLAPWNVCSAIEAAAAEYKFYAPTIGFVGDDDSLRLVKYGFIKAAK